MKTAKKQNSPFGELQKIRMLNLRPDEPGEHLNMCSSISESRTTAQADTTEFSYSSHNLNLLIQQQRLSDCLEFLENRGYTGDSAIFIMASLQLQGGVA